MAEIILRTHELKTVKPKYTAWRPKGSAIACISEHEKRRKWLEIVCDLVSPKKRDNYKNLPGWQHLVDHWAQELWDEWFQLNRPTEKFRLGPLLQDKSAAQKMWDEAVDSQLPAVLGKEPRQYKMLTDTWLWSEHERKNWFIIYNENATDEELTGYGLGKQYVNQGTIILSSGIVVDYENDIGLSAGSISDINNKETVVHPKLDSIVDKIKFNSPDVSSIE